MSGLIILIVVAFAVFYVITMYNRLIQYRIHTENAWSQIDVQLKRRHDLIPNLVETVKGVMQFEKETLTKVIEARSRAVGAASIQERVKAEGEISGLMGRLLAVWEKYPDLKSNVNAMSLQEEITTTENKIAYSRGYYNDITANFRALVQQFPSNFIARTFNIVWNYPFFEVSSVERENPHVRF